MEKNVIGMDSSNTTIQSLPDISKVNLPEPPDITVLRTCTICASPSTQICSGCGSIGYCGPDHRKEHWKNGHNWECSRNSKPRVCCMEQDFH